MTLNNITINKEFVWTDDLVKHAVKVLGAAYNNPDLYNDGKWEGIGKELDKFKASHTTEQIERDWEVLSYLNLNHNSVMEAQVQPSDLGDPTRWDIYAVKRFSDNSVFRVGDEVDSTWGKQKITEFSIRSDGDMVVMFETCCTPIQKISKLPDRTKLFTTEDGVDIYEPTRLWIVHENFVISNAMVSCDFKNLRSLEYLYVPSNNKYFYSQASANEYITLNRSVLSVTDILKLDLHWGRNDVVYVYKDKLIEIAKSKL